MAFSQDNGYVPATIAEIMDALMAGINTQFGTTYTTETFIGTNFYKYFYSLAQRLQENEVKTSEIFAKLQQYIATTNEMISRPVVTNPGVLENLESEGYICSIKPMINADAGKISICVDKTVASGDWEDSAGYATDKLAVCGIIKDSTVAGAVTQGTESSTLTLTNGQAFDFKYCLPNRIPVALRLTTVLSENNQLPVGDPDDTKLLLLANIAADYRLGKNFAPQRYFAVEDAPWAQSVLLEWTDDVTAGVVDGGAVWHSTVYDADFDDLFVVSLALIELVET
jgi:hypothetical protein